MLTVKQLYTARIEIELMIIAESAEDARRIASRSLEKEASNVNWTDFDADLSNGKKAADAACEVTALLTRELARKFERIRGIVVRRLGAELCLYAWREDGGGIYTCPYCASRHAFVLHEHMIDVCRSDAIQL